ncbi:hypothetical protein ACFVJ5_15695 [Nocardia sp. NPDC127606]|uniref:hypothetical protein n=1 Tax=Nocardia sp. NPDC127606 TaxID=3345406 RepID=UPI0036376319
MQKLFTVMLALVVAFGVAGCEPDGAGKEAGDKAQEVVCEMVVPIVEAVAVRIRAG